MNASFHPGIRTCLVLGKTKIIFQGTFRDNVGSEMVGTYPGGSENFQSSRVFRMFLGCFWCFQQHWAGTPRNSQRCSGCAPFLSTADRKSDPNAIVMGPHQRFDIHNSSRRLSCLVTQEWHRLIHLYNPKYIQEVRSKTTSSLMSLTNLPGIKMNGDGYK